MIRLIPSIHPSLCNTHPPFAAPRGKAEKFRFRFFLPDYKKSKLVSDRTHIVNYIDTTTLAWVYDSFCFYPRFKKLPFPGWDQIVSLIELIFGFWLACQTWDDDWLHHYHIDFFNLVRSIVFRSTAASFSAVVERAQVIQSGVTKTEF